MQACHRSLGLIEVTQTVNQRIHVVAIKRGKTKDLREDPMERRPVSNFGRVYEHLLYCPTSVVWERRP